MRRHMKNPKFRIKIFPKVAELVSKFGYLNLPMRKTKFWAGPSSRPTTHRMLNKIGVNEWVKIVSSEISTP